MAATKYLTIDGLTHFKDKLDTLFVKQEEGKGLSQENFTTEFKNHIEAEMSFDGSYDTLTGKPAIDGTELTSSSTAESLGLAKKTDLPKAATTKLAGIVKPDGTTITVTDDGTISVNELSAYLKTEDADKKYAKTTDVPGVATVDKAGTVKPDNTTIKVTEDGTINAVLDDYAKKTDLPTKATAEAEGIVKPDGTTITVVDGTISAELSAYAKSADLPTFATAEKEGLVKPDDTTIEVDESGVISLKGATDYAKKTDLPKVATADTAGTVKIGDNITLSEDGTGTISVTFPEGSDDILTKTAAKSEYLTQTSAEETYAKTSDITDMVTNTSLTSKLEPYAKTETVTTSIESAKSDVLEQVNTKIASTYKAKGSKATVTELPAASADTVGDVYNMSAGFTTDDKFETSGTYYPKGTNVVVADMGDETYKYDVLAGDYDLSIYLKTADVVAITNGEIDALFATD